MVRGNRVFASHILLPHCDELLTDANNSKIPTVVSMKGVYQATRSQIDVSINYNNMNAPGIVLHVLLGELKYVGACEESVRPLQRILSDSEETAVVFASIAVVIDVLLPFVRLCYWLEQDAFLSPLVEEVMDAVLVHMGKKDSVLEGSQHWLACRMLSDYGKLHSRETQKRLDKAITDAQKKARASFPDMKSLIEKHFDQNIRCLYHACRMLIPENMVALMSSVKESFNIGDRLAKVVSGTVDGNMASVIQNALKERMKKEFQVWRAPMQQQVQELDWNKLLEDVREASGRNPFNKGENLVSWYEQNGINTIDPLLNLARLTIPHNAGIERNFASIASLHKSTQGATSGMRVGSMSRERSKGTHLLASDRIQSKLDKEDNWGVVPTYQSIFESDWDRLEYKKVEKEKTK